MLLRASRGLRDTPGAAGAVRSDQLGRPFIPDATGSGTPVFSDLYGLSRQIATYFVSDNPPDSLAQKMPQTFKTSDRDIAAVLADRLAELGRGLAGFSEEVGPAAWRDTVVVVISEFGRTFRENGDRGTDHGHGSVYWVMGGGINGGRILGEQVKVEQASLFQNRDYRVLTDYRAMFAGLFGRMYGLDGAAIQRVFTGVHPAELGIV